MRSPFRALSIALPAKRRGVFLAVAISTHLVASWCNGGFLNADEHYQIIEFAQYKLDGTPASSLAWEFRERMRPAFQPWIAAAVIRADHAVGIASPFLVAFSLRLLSAALALWVTFELCARCLEPIDVPWARETALWLSLALWVTPTAHGRFSSENWGGALFAGGLCLMLGALEAWPVRRGKGILLAACTGLVWSVAFYCRFQMALAFAGGALWLLVVRRAPLAAVVAIAGGFAIGCGLNETLDRWLYGVWTCAPCNYFWINIVQGKASTFGTSPWWMLTVYMVVTLIPPFSLALLALFIVGIWYARRHVLVWVTVPFVIVHTLVLHKEPRFLIPLLYVAGPLFAVCVDELPARVRAGLVAWMRTPFGRVNLSAWCVVNAVLLSVAILVPVNDQDRLRRWLWAQGRTGPVTVYTMGRSPYRLGTTEVINSFYRSPNVDLRPLAAGDPILASPVRESSFVLYTGVEAPAVVTAAGPCTLVLRSFPLWLTRWPLFARLTDVEVATLCRIDPTSPAR